MRGFRQGDRACTKLRKRANGSVVLEHDRIARLQPVRQGLPDREGRRPGWLALCPSGTRCKSQDTECHPSGRKHWLAPRGGFALPGAAAAWTGTSGQGGQGDGHDGLRIPRMRTPPDRTPPGVGGKARQQCCPSLANQHRQLLLPAAIRDNASVIPELLPSSSHSP